MRVGSLRSKEERAVERRVDEEVELEEIGTEVEVWLSGVELELEGRFEVEKEVEVED